MDVDNLISFWGDISVVVLSTLLDGQGDEIQSLTVNIRAEQIVRHMKSSGIERGTFDRSVNTFMDIRNEFSAGPLSKSTPMDLVLPTLVAIAVRNDLNVNLSDEDFTSLVQRSQRYLAGG
jgi:hypothetical protein